MSSAWCDGVHEGDFELGSQSLSRVRRVTKVTDWHRMSQHKQGMESIPVGGGGGDLVQGTVVTGKGLGMKGEQRLHKETASALCGMGGSLT